MDGGVEPVDGGVEPVDGGVEPVDAQLQGKRTHIHTGTYICMYTTHIRSWDKTSGSTLMRLTTHGNQRESRLSGDSEWLVATLSVLQYLEQGKHIPLGSLEGQGEKRMRRQDGERGGALRRGRCSLQQNTVLSQLSKPSSTTHWLVLTIDNS